MRPKKRELLVHELLYTEMVKSGTTVLNSLLVYVLVFNRRLYCLTWLKIHFVLLLLQMHGSVMLPSRPKVAEIASRFAGGDPPPLTKKDSQSTPLSKKEPPGLPKKPDLTRPSLPLSATSSKVQVPVYIGP